MPTTKTSEFHHHVAHQPTIHLRLLRARDTAREPAWMQPMAMRSGPFGGTVFGFKKHQKTSIFFGDYVKETNTTVILKSKRQGKSKHVWYVFVD